jgi:hypothetical protein
MTLLLASFGPFDTTFLPGAGLWTSASSVTIIAGGGRSGDASDNCAAFDTTLNSIMSRTVTPATITAFYTATYGFACRVLTLTTTATLAIISTATSQYALVVSSDGSLKITQTTNGVLQGTICTTSASAVPVGTGGFYVEVQIQFTSGATTCQINVSDQYGDMNPLVVGGLITADAGPYTTFSLGGGTGEAPATFRITDVYLNDGVPATTAIAYKGRLIYNDSFLGNVHIEAIYPTADGANLSVGNTPWVPNIGTTQYTQIDEHPPDEDFTYDSADTDDQTSTFAFQSPHSKAFGRLNCATEAPIFAVQWDGRLRATTDSGTIVPIVRRVVTGTIPGDSIAEGNPQVVSLTVYQYFPQVFTRNPIDNTPWNFAVFYPSAVGAVGTTEFGVRLL